MAPDGQAAGEPPLGNTRRWAITVTVMLVLVHASMLLLALFTQKLMSYDAWTSGLVLAPSGIGQALMLVIVGRLVSRTDQRWLLGFGVLMNGLATLLMSNASLSSDFWALAWPRLIQGIGMGCIFVPLQMLALASVPISQLPNATALFSVVRNVGGSAGGGDLDDALEPALVAHVNIWDPETAERLRQWTDHFVSRGADTVTAGRQAMAMLYRETQVQAQVLAFMDDFRVLAVMYAALVVLVILMRRVRTTPAAQGASSAQEPARAIPAE